MLTCWERWRSSIRSRRIWASLSLSSNIIALFHWSMALPRPSLSSSVRVWDRLTLSIFIPSMLYSSSFCRASNNMASSSRIRYTKTSPSIINLINLVVSWSKIKGGLNPAGILWLSRFFLGWTATSKAHMLIKTKPEKTWLACDHAECETRLMWEGNSFPGGVIKQRTNRWPCEPGPSTVFCSPVLHPGTLFAYWRAPDRQQSEVRSQSLLVGVKPNPVQPANPPTPFHTSCVKLPTAFNKKWEGFSRVQIKTTSAGHWVVQEQPNPEV